MKRPISEEGLLSLLSRFKKKKIAVLGDVGIDRYTQGSVERISPEAPVPIVFVQNEYLKLGLAANVADNIYALGGEAKLTGVTGTDDDGRALYKMLNDKKFSTSSLVNDPTRRTILKERIVAETQQMLRVDYESIHPLAKAIQQKVQASILKSVKTADAIIIEDYAKGLLNKSVIAATIKEAKKRKIPVLVDPHVKTPVEWYEGATLLTPNKREAEALARMRIYNDETLQAASKIIMSRTKVESLVITLGREGMAIFMSGKSKPLRIPTFAREVYDVSGAGDTVISVLALSLAAGAKLDEAAYVSNLAAGVEVSKRGTATVSPQEIVEAFLSH